ncbi:MAG TPA: O-antigen ligase family protein [Actinopolymorphaceae bacterium]|jgi:O-antigen ligase
MTSWTQLETRGVRPHVMAFLAGYVVLLYAVPSRLVVGPLGSAGAPSMLVGLVSILGWVLYQLSRKPEDDWRLQDLRVRPVRVALGAFCVCVGISFVVAMLRPIDGDEVSPASVAILALASWSGTMLVTHDMIPSRRRLETLTALLAWSGGVLAILGVIQFVTGQLWIDRITIPGLTATQLGNSFSRAGFARPVGTATHPIEYGVLLAMLLPFTLYWALHGTSRSRACRWLPALAMAAVMPLTSSRSAYIGATVCLVVLSIGWPTARRRALLVSVVGLGVVMFAAVPGLIGTIRGLFLNSGTDPSVASRTASYGTAMAFIEKAPFFGRGLGTFLPRYRILDNEYLLLLVTVGVAGTLAFLALIGTAVATLIRARRRSADPATRDLALSIVAAVVSGTVSLALFDAFAFPMTMGTLFLIFGMAGALDRLIPLRQPVLGTRTADRRV